MLPELEQFQGQNARVAYAALYHNYGCLICLTYSFSALWLMNYS